MNRLFLSIVILFLSLHVSAQYGSTCPEDLVPAYSETKKAWGYKNFFDMWVVEPIFTKVSPYVENKAIVQNGLLFGVIDCDGNVIIHCEYQALANFRYGKIWAMKNDLWGLLDQKGNVLLDFQFSEVRPIRLTELSWVKKGDVWGLFNEEKGQWTCRPQFATAEYMSESCSMVKIGDKMGVLNHVNCGYLIPLEITSVKKYSLHVIKYEANGKWGMFNDDGKIILPAEYDEIDEVYEKYYYRVKKGNLYGIREWNGKELLPVKYEEIGEFSNGFFKIKEKGKYGYASKLGKIYIQPQYDEASNFYFGEAIVGKNGKYGIIDIKNVFKADPVFDRITISSGKDYYVYTSGSNVMLSIAPVPYGEMKKEHISFAAAVETDRIAFIRVRENTQWKFYNLLNGNYSFGGSFDEAEAFKEGFSIVTIAGKKGVIDENGKKIIEPSMDKVEYRSFGARVVFYTQQNAKWGITETTGKILLAPEYDLIAWAAPNFLKLKKDGKYGVIKTTGAAVIPFEYDFISNSEENPAMPDWPAHAIKKGKHLFVNENGTEISLGKASSVSWLGQSRYKVQVSKSFSLLDAKGTIYPAKYEDIRIFSGELAAAKQQGKWGFINAADKFVIAAEYEEVSDFQNKLAVVKKNGKYGVINNRGKITVEPTYDSYKVEANGIRMLQSGSKSYKVDP